MEKSYQYSSCESLSTLDFCLFDSVLSISLSLSLCLSLSLSHSFGSFPCFICVHLCFDLITYYFQKNNFDNRWQNCHVQLQILQLCCLECYFTWNDLIVPTNDFTHLWQAPVLF